jgi:hypothetical protein
MAKYSIDVNTASITVTMTPREAYELIHGQPYGEVILNLPVWLQTLETHLKENHEHFGRRCPGSGQPGVPNGALLHCPVCSRLIGVCPPVVLPEHDKPAFETERPVL